ncbi:MAG TPA: hypothetical protein VGM46_02290 [Mesorhizobium sp.]
MTKSKTLKIETPDLAMLDIPGFEDDLGDALYASTEDGALPDAEDVEQDAQPVDGDVQVAAAAPRQSTATRANLAALAAFDGEMRSASAGLDAMETTMAALGSAHEAARRLLGNLHAGVIRANDLEEANAALLADNRRLAERLEQSTHLQSQLQSTDEVNRRRIELLARDHEDAKLALGKSQLEAIELNAAFAEADGERTALTYELAAKSTAADRLARENELTRQKLANQQMLNTELEQRHAELERKLEEVISVRKAETAEMSELRMRFDSVDKEYKRLQKQSELSQARLVETQERLMSLEADLDELGNRHGAAAERFRTETETLKTKLEAANRKALADAEEIASLKLEVGDAVSAANVVSAQLACANGQIDAFRSSSAALTFKRTGQTGGETITRGPVSYDRDRTAKKAKKPLAETSRTAKPESRVVHPRKEHG